MNMDVNALVSGWLCLGWLNVELCGFGLIPLGLNRVKVATAFESSASLRNAIAIYLTSSTKTIQMLCTA